MLPVQRINFYKLETAALKRYRRFYKLPDVGNSKDQLVMAVGKHFMSQVRCELCWTSWSMAACHARGCGITCSSTGIFWLHACWLYPQRADCRRYAHVMTPAQTVDESQVIALFVAAARRAALEPREP